MFDLPKSRLPISWIFATTIVIVMGVVPLACGDSGATTTPAHDGAVEDSASEASVVEDAGFKNPAASSCTALAPYSFGSSKCDECVATSCCPKLTACTNATPCKSLMECTLGCIDEPITERKKCADDCRLHAEQDAADDLWLPVEWCVYFDNDACTVECSLPSSRFRK